MDPLVPDDPGAGVVEVEVVHVAVPLGVRLGAGPLGAAVLARVDRLLAPSRHEPEALAAVGCDDEDVGAGAVRFLGRHGHGGDGRRRRRQPLGLALSGQPRYVLSSG